MNIIAKKPVNTAIIFYLVFITFYFFNFSSNFSTDNSDWGTFGDFIGGSLNPILGIITIVLTYDIIKNQIIENKQSEFKYMFQILFEVIEKNEKLIQFKRFGKTYSDKEALKIINNNIENLYKSLNIGEDITDEKRYENFQTAFWSVFEDINKSSSTLMKTLHNIFKVIDKYCIYDRRTTYSDLIRAQFHYEELKFIMYNGIADENFNGFKKRIEKFTILKDLKNDDRIDSFLKGKYTDLAFAEVTLNDEKKFTKTILNYQFYLKVTKKAPNNS